MLKSPDMTEKKPGAAPKEVLKRLHQDHDNPKTELENWTNPIQFMMAVILSAQATDVGVNKVTPALFKKYKNAKDFAGAKVADVMELVKSINYYKTKSQRIVDAAKFVVENFKGTLPPDINELIKIPGIGRKSANVIIHEALEEAQTQGIVVDTHVTRVSYRLGLTPYDNQKDAVKIESELKNLLPESEWQFYSNAAVLHGRYVCKAKKPECATCSMNDICPSSQL